MITLFDLSGKVALVTGARTGLGQGMALALADAGADIVALGSSPMPETAGLVRKTGRRFHALEVDLSKGGIRVPAYSASKHGITGLTKAMANELAPHGITVNAIAHGYMATENTEALRNDPDRNAQISARIPMGRWGTPDNLATSVLFFAAPASGYDGHRPAGRRRLARPIGRRGDDDFR